MNCIKEAERLRDLGFVVIPLRGKIQDGTPSEIADWKKNGCSKEIKDFHNIGFQHGLNSGTFALDFDHPTILNDVVTNEEDRKKMMIVKTGMKGHHLIFKLKPDDLPPGDIKMHDGVVDEKLTKQKHKENPKDTKKYGLTGEPLREIDIRIKGYTVCAPSIHPETQNRYEFVNPNITKPPVSGWKHIAEILADHGFTRSIDAASIRHALIGDSNDYSELIAGGFSRGKRRRKLRSYYIKLRMYDWKQLSNEDGQKLAASKYRILNQTCIPPPK